ncbi:hypothetical protein SDC9_146653 [bioreactor metagenome]|uniref:Uncharacterized protein n=1 Tax=bioreactor metagenome TaxID=1076179 RepID=A0A645EFS3_9ZZZZ
MCFARQRADFLTELLQFAHQTHRQRALAIGKGLQLLFELLVHRLPNFTLLHPQLLNITPEHFVCKQALDDVAFFIQRFRPQLLCLDLACLFGYPHSTLTRYTAPKHQMQVWVVILVVKAGVAV